MHDVAVMHPKMRPRASPPRGVGFGDVVFEKERRCRWSLLMMCRWNILHSSPMYFVYIHLFNIIHLFIIIQVFQFSISSIQFLKIITFEIYRHYMAFLCPCTWKANPSSCCCDNSPQNIICHTDSSNIHHNLRNHSCKTSLEHIWDTVASYTRTCSIDQ